MWLVITVISNMHMRLPLKDITKQHLKNTRVKFHLQGLVHIHHIIPRQFRNHPVLKGFDIEDGQNFIFMPTELGKQQLNTIRLTHDKGHKQYNKFVGHHIEKIYRNFPLDCREKEIQKLVLSLRRNLTSHSNIPWR